MVIHETENRVQRSSEKVRYMTREKISYPIHLVLEGIVKQAERDGVITKEEADLINRIQIDARELEKRVKEFVETKRPTAEELEKFLAEQREVLIKQATEEAEKDGIISEDEKSIINRLIQELEKYKG